jgi:hypothetical protein
LTNVPPNRRVHDAIDVAWSSRLLSNKGPNKKSEAELKQGFFIDISQGVERKSWGKISTLCQGISDLKTSFWETHYFLLRAVPFHPQGRLHNLRERATSRPQQAEESRVSFRPL